MKEKFRYSEETGNVKERTLAEEFFEYPGDQISVTAGADGVLYLPETIDHRRIDALIDILEKQALWVRIVQAGTDADPQIEKENRDDWVAIPGKINEIEEVLNDLYRNGRIEGWSTWCLGAMSCQVHGAKNVSVKVGGKDFGGSDQWYWRNAAERALERAGITTYRSPDVATRE